MVDQILQEISQAEDLAVQRERQAAAEAASLVQQARAEALRLHQEGLLADERRMAAELSDFDAKTAERMAGRLGDSAREAERLRAEASQNMQAAVSLIVEGVRSEYGHR